MSKITAKVKIPFGPHRGKSVSELPDPVLIDLVERPAFVFRDWLRTGLQKEYERRALDHAQQHRIEQTLTLEIPVSLRELAENIFEAGAHNLQETLAKHDGDLFAKIQRLRANITSQLKTGDQK